MQVGVSIWHAGECGQKGLPDVFEPVARFAEWIHKKTRGEAKMYPPYEHRHTNCSTYYKYPENGSQPVLDRFDNTQNGNAPEDEDDDGGKEDKCDWSKGSCRRRRRRSRRKN